MFKKFTLHIKQAKTKFCSSYFVKVEKKVKNHLPFYVFVKLIKIKEIYLKNLTLYT